MTSNRDKLDDRLFDEIGKCTDSIGVLSEVVHTHSGILKGQNIIIAGLVVAIMGLAFGVLSDYIKINSQSLDHKIKSTSIMGVVK